MTEGYFVIKREKCENPHLTQTVRESRVPPHIVCAQCGNSGYIETRVDLLEVLGKLRFKLENYNYIDGKQLVDAFIED